MSNSCDILSYIVVENILMQVVDTSNLVITIFGLFQAFVIGIQNSR